MEKIKRKKSSINKRKLAIISIIIIIIILLLTLYIIFINNEHNNNTVSQEITSISDIIYNINDNYLNNNGKLIGQIIKYSEAQATLSNISKNITLKINDYDGYDVNDNYYYYIISGKDLKDYGINKLGATYIINYSTGEVINKNVSEYTEISEVYTYREDLSSLNIIEGQVETYNITYDLDGGEIPNELENITSYNKTMEYKLLNPIKEGYNFIGWTGSNGDTPQIDVTITKESTGDKTFKANYEVEDDITNIKEEEPVGPAI